ncbi:hypothetical protein [Clostridium baratii]|uniref:hypothetical protein n=1 Tax=Clostridium baratii TaxID=1561 RepID=UPI0030D31B3D
MINLKNNINSIIDNKSIEDIKEIKDDLDHLVKYFIKKGYKCEVIKFDKHKYLVIKKDKVSCFMNITKDVNKVVKYNFWKFRYNIKTDCIEKFNVLSFISNYRDKEIFNIIEYIEEELKLNTAFEWVNKFKIKKSENKLLNNINELLRSLNFKTIIAKLEFLGEKREVIFFTKTLDRMLDTNTTFLLLNKNDELYFSSILYYEGEILNIGDLYGFEKIDKLSKNMLEKILI